MKKLKDIPWGAIFVFIVIPVVGLATCTWHTAWETERFGDGTCHACQTGHYELFDIEHTRNSGDRYYYRCDTCHDVKRYDSFQGG